ncbi:Trimethyllysine dioxygenase [Candida viswanathii]|uniref:Trimethyllysine dioxygenase n=1 Tax=Candida viswanathii TaxID=5486 RepID=A0A367YGF3_9ASCO|nr:Trimethyllysine dioxygenase [Candida viswanathii]RCK64847.1 Trimethyllysine dioxygenase [Candida viswanathii]
MSVTTATPLADNHSIELAWSDNKTSTYHNIWLRDNCHCSACYYTLTKQRLLNSASIDPNIRPQFIAVNAGTQELEITWDQDEHVSKYDFHWLRLHSYLPRLVPVTDKLQGADTLLARELWQVKDIENNMPRVDYHDVMAATDDNEDAIKDWSLKIWRHGFCLIDNVPVTPEDTERLCEKLNYIRPTHYGGFWDFTSDLAKADTAYTNFDISSHTDGTYWSNTPGLQLFHLLFHDGTGGTTSLVDAFKCAEILKEKHPESYEVMTRIKIPAHSAGEEKVCIQPDEPRPIFKLDENGELLQVRWNQSDRSTMDSWENPEDVPKFYEAIRNWVSIISSPENEIFYQLKPGQCLIFDNWRCFHLRTEFTGKRRLCGAYIERDDFVSRLKLLVLGRQAVLDAI